MKKLNPKKICVLVDQLNTGGVQKVAINEVIYLNKLGFQAELVVMVRIKNMPLYHEYKEMIPISFLSETYTSLLSYAPSRDI